MEDHSVSKLMQHSPLLRLDERGIIVRCSISWKELSDVEDNHPGEGTEGCIIGNRAEGAPSNKIIVCFVYSLDRHHEVGIIEFVFRPGHGDFCFPAPGIVR